MHPGSRARPRGRKAARANTRIASPWQLVRSACSLRINKTQHSALSTQHSALSTHLGRGTARPDHAVGRVAIRDVTYVGAGRHLQRRLPILQTPVIGDQHSHRGRVVRDRHDAPLLR